MSQKAVKILLVYDPDGSRSEIRELLLKTDISEFKLDHVSTGFAGVSFRPDYYNVCIIDSASAGPGLLEESRRVGFTTPIIMLTSDSAYEVLNALRRGNRCGRLLGRCDERLVLMLLNYCEALGHLTVDEVNRGKRPKPVGAWELTTNL